MSDWYTRRCAARPRPDGKNVTPAACTAAFEGLACLLQYHKRGRPPQLRGACPAPSLAGRPGGGCQPSPVIRRQPARPRRQLIPPQPQPPAKAPRLPAGGFSLSRPCPGMTALPHSARIGRGADGPGFSRRRRRRHRPGEVFPASCTRSARGSMRHIPAPRVSAERHSPLQAARLRPRGAEAGSRSAPGTGRSGGAFRRDGTAAPRLPATRCRHQRVPRDMGIDADDATRPDSAREPASGPSDAAFRQEEHDMRTVMTSAVQAELQALNRDLRPLHNGCRAKKKTRALKLSRRDEDDFDNHFQFRYKATQEGLFPSTSLSRAVGPRPPPSRGKA